MVKDVRRLTLGVRRRATDRTYGTNVLAAEHLPESSAQQRRTPKAKPRTPNAERLNPLKTHLRPIDLVSALGKELFQGGRIKGTVLFRIHPQEDLSARPEEPLLQIIE